MAKKAQEFDAKKFGVIAARAREQHDFYEDQRGEGAFVRCHPVVFEEMVWLVNELEKHVGKAEKPNEAVEELEEATV